MADAQPALTVKCMRDNAVCVCACMAKKLTVGSSKIASGVKPAEVKLAPNEVHAL